MSRVGSYLPLALRVRIELTLWTLDLSFLYTVRRLCTSWLHRGACLPIPPLPMIGDRTRTCTAALRVPLPHYLLLLDRYQPELLLPVGCQPPDY